MAHQADRRAHLDLQIKLLDEQENTMMLRMLESLCEQQGTKTQSLKEEIQSLFEKTDVHALMPSVVTKAVQAANSVLFDDGVDSLPQERKGWESTSRWSPSILDAICR